MTGTRFKCVLYFLASNDLELQPTECVFGSFMNAINGPIHSDTQKNMKTPIKNNRGYFGTSKNTPFWLFLAPPADPVEFFWFKMAGKGVPHIDTCSMLDSHL